MSKQRRAGARLCTFGSCPRGHVGAILRCAFESGRKGERTAFRAFTLQRKLPMREESNKEEEPRAKTVLPKGEEEWGRDLAACERRLREVVDLAAHIRHEINNPLTGLIGQAQLLLRDESLNEAARRRVETVEQLAKRIRDIVAELRVVQHTGPAPASDASAAGAAATPASDGEPPRH